MKNFQIEFVVSGTNELRKGTISGKNESSVKSFIVSKYGFCSHFKANQL